MEQPLTSSDSGSIINYNYSAIEKDTIVAISTPQGPGGIAVIRLSGADAILILKKCWQGKNPDSFVSHTAHFGEIILEDDSVLDEVVATFFKGPKSFTGEDIVEISCHGSMWIQREIVHLLVRNGARAAAPGEFTQRAFLNGKMDLAQAEGVMDLISSSSKAAHKMAMQQTNGKFSEYFQDLRGRLIDFASMLELELDFSEEDVEFADRKRLTELCDNVISSLSHLQSSYSTGKAIKEGIPVVIAGEPNAGKSTLLNMLLDEEKAIVTDIAGTTRDIIEDTAEIGGMMFRLADTAGLRETTDKVERIGIDRAEQRLGKAAIILWVIDTTTDVNRQLGMAAGNFDKYADANHIILLNKSDLTSESCCERITAYGSTEVTAIVPESNDNSVKIGTDSLKYLENIDNNIRRKLENKIIIEIAAKSGKEGHGYEALEKAILRAGIAHCEIGNDIILSNARHYEAISRGLESMRRVRYGLDARLSADFIAQDVRETLHHLSYITGAITTPDLLSTIFSRFCIGK